MQSFNHRLIQWLGTILRFIFSLDTFITVLFLGGIGIILYTIAAINMLAFGFALGFVLIGLAVLLNMMMTRP